jgi:hypothetical protein
MLNIHSWHAICLDIVKSTLTRVKEGVAMNGISKQLLGLAGGAAALALVAAAPSANATDLGYGDLIGTWDNTGPRRRRSRTQVRIT